MSLQRAAGYCRERKGPALVHAHVTRPYSHSLSDDDKLYKCPSEREAEAQRDPLPKFGLFLIREGLLSEKEIEQSEAEVDREIIEATDRALPAALPSKDSDYLLGLFARCRSGIGCVCDGAAVLRRAEDHGRYDSRDACR